MRHGELGHSQWNALFSFEAYLRTGRLVMREPAERFVEAKFNPWHDPDDGRFTFAGTGKYFGRGSNQELPDAGGSFGGGGATGSWDRPSSSRNSQSPARERTIMRSSRVAPSARSATIQASVAQAAPKDEWRRILRNGYEFRIDTNGRTRQVSGTLSVASAQPRSRAAQAGAGGTDRRPTDDGGHYIAHRFNGPTDAFNHFAQDSNFNRGGYRAIEDQWAKAKREGKKVQVRITPIYGGPSLRPARLTSGLRSMARHSEKAFPTKPRVTGMSNVDVERLLSEIGQILGEDREYTLDGTLLYAEVDSNWVAPSVFKDLGNRILFRWPSDSLTYPLLELWEAEHPDRRWSAIEYVTRDGRFDAFFTYREEIDPQEDKGDRRNRIVRKYFGDKPIEYPPLPGDDDRFNL